MNDKKTMVENQGRHQDTQQQAASGQAREQAGLQQRYGTIGIDAVAAAVRYSNPGKKAEPAAAPRIDQRFEQD